MNSEIPDEEDIAAPQVWIERVEIQGHEHRQSGDLKLGNALYRSDITSPSEIESDPLREASVDDIVLHLLEERQQIVAISTINSEVMMESEAKEEIEWVNEQGGNSGIFRWLNDFEKLDDPIDIRDNVLSNDKYESDLQKICLEYCNVFFDKDLNLAENGYFTPAPTELLTILTEESKSLLQALEARGYPIERIPTTHFEQIDEYESVSSAAEDIQSRINQIPGQENFIEERIATSIIDDWTDAIADFQAESTIGSEREIRFSQIRELYQRSELELTKQAEEIGSGSLEDLNEAQTLFLVLLRDLQNSIERTPNLTSERTKAILLELYDLQDARGGTTAIQLPDWSPAEDSAVYVLSAPADYWVTALDRRAVAFNENRESDWARVSQGDLLILNSTAETNRPDLSSPSSGIIGVCIAGKATTKSSNWWWEEDQTKEWYPYLISFDRLFLTGKTPSKDAANSSPKSISNEWLEDAIESVTTNALPTQKADEICQESAGGRFPESPGVSKLTDRIEDEPARPLIHELNPSLSEAPPIAIHRPFSGTIPEDVLKGLYFPDNGDRELVEQIGASLRGGKHVIFTGPPGTGKTEIARRVGEYLHEEYPYLYSGAQMTTATADWSTFDTVGGYMPESSVDEGSESLSFTPGVVLRRLKKMGTGTQMNESIVIDEINRADIDKAFGQLFTTLSGQSVQLPFEQDDYEIELHTADKFMGLPGQHQYVIPESWRIFATMNTYDKTSLYEMSYAFMRRFAFIRVGAPDLPRDEGDLEQLVEEYVAVWDDVESSPKQRRLVGRVWSAVNAADGGRKIGPAIIHDILAYLESHESMNLDQKLTQAVISYVFPQLEGAPKRKKVLNALSNVSKIDTDLLDRAGQEMLDTGPLSE